MKIINFKKYFTYIYKIKITANVIKRNVTTEPSAELNLLQFITLIQPLHIKMNIVILHKHINSTYLK